MGPLREMQQSGRRGGEGGAHGKMIKGREEGRERKAVDTDTDTSCRLEIATSSDLAHPTCPSASTPVGSL